MSKNSKGNSDSVIFRLLYLAKMKFRSEYSEPSSTKQKGFKIRKKIKHTRKAKTGYSKKRAKKNFNHVQ